MRQLMKSKVKSLLVWIQDRTWIQKIVIAGLTVIVATMWPLCIIRDDYSSRSGDGGHAFTEEMQQGMVFTQNFYAEKSYLEAVDYALEFDHTMPLEGKFLFELLDEKGKVLFSTEHPFNLTPDYSYCSIEVGKRLKRGGLYQYRLTNVDVVQNLPKVIYTEEESMHAAINCGMTFGGSSVAGEALSRYHWKVPFDWKKTVSYGSFLGMFAFVIYELEEIRVARKKRK